MVIRQARFCTLCATPLVQEHVHGALRPVCPACGHIVYFDPKVAVTVFIEQDERVLLVRRAHEPARGLWAMPAGFVEWDEAPEDAALRETLEETGLQVRVTDLLAVFPRRDKGLADIVISYRARVVGGILQAGDDADDARFFTRDALPELAFYPSRYLIGERWRQGAL